MSGGGEKRENRGGRKKGKKIFLTCPRGTSSIAVSPPAASKASTRSFSPSPSPSSEPGGARGLNQRVSPEGRPRSSGHELRPSTTTSRPPGPGESETRRGACGGGRRAGVGRRCVGWIWLWDCPSRRGGEGEEESGGEGEETGGGVAGGDGGDAEAEVASGGAGLEHRSSSLRGRADGGGTAALRPGASAAAAAGRARLLGLSRRLVFLSFLFFSGLVVDVGGWGVEFFFPPSSFAASSQRAGDRSPAFSPLPRPSVAQRGPR